MSSIDTVITNTFQQIKMHEDENIMFIKSLSMNTFTILINWSNVIMNYPFTYSTKLTHSEIPNYREPIPCIADIIYSHKD